jgi:2-amino-4-hydroxy-6-hydroxymethyldihydropteridine diphosphokinase
MEISISLGSNIEPLLNIKKAQKLISNKFNILKSSSLYSSNAEGFVGNSFINQVIACDTKLSFEESIKALKDIEKVLGRKKNSEKFSNRLIDLDLLTYGNETINKIDKEVPHKDIEEYAFVLVPLCEISPDNIHPNLNISFKQLLKSKEGFFDKVSKLD